MEEIAGWVAPAATMIAAMMTASNLGARFTGWGFVVFTVGSIAWTTVGLTSDQANLVYSNGFLTIVNLVGIWRWLGRQAKFDDAAKAAEARSGTLFSGSTLVGLPVVDTAGTTLAHVVEPMVDCASGRVDHLIIRRGGTAGIGETLHLLPWRETRMLDGRLEVGMPASRFEKLAAAPTEPA